MNSLEELKIYQNCVDLLFYTYNITIKFPKVEKTSLVQDVKLHTTKVLEEVIIAQKEFNSVERLRHLNVADSELKLLKALVRVSYRFKYISSKNYGAWSKKISNVSNPLLGWIKRCQKQ